MIDLLFNDPEGLVNRSSFNERFGILNRLYRHWWKKRINVTSGQYVESKTNQDTRNLFYNGNPATNVSYIRYSSTITISASGVVSLSNPQTLTFSWDTKNKLSVLSGKYFYSTQTVPAVNGANAGDGRATTANQIYYCISAPTKSGNFGDDAPYTHFVYCTSQEVSSVYITDNTIGEWEYMWSEDRGSYPDSGIINGYEHQYLGIPFENAREAPKIEVGSYVGTGTFGSSSPNTLTFSFTPIIWGVFRMVSTGGVDNPVPNIMLWDNNYQNMNVSVFKGVGSTTTHYITINGNSVSWYASTSSDGQLNSNIYTYHYFAIG